MRKRIFAGVFWWLAVAYFWQFAAAMYDFPRGLGWFIALLVALLFAADPLGVIWGTRRRRLTRIADRRVPDGMPSPTTGGS